MNRMFLFFALLGSIAAFPVSAHAVELPECGDSTCKAEAPLTREPNWPGYLDSKSKVETLGWDGDCVDSEPCKFRLTVDIREESTFGPAFIVAILKDDIPIYQSANGMWGIWDFEFKCGAEPLEFEIVSLEEAAGLSKLATIKFECNACKLASPHK